MFQLDWHRFHKDCHILSGRIAASGREYQKMLCISRGGVFVGGLVAHHLGIRNITTIALALYQGREQSAAITQLSAPDLPQPGSRLLVVDDLLDSGKTIEYIVETWGDEYDLDLAVLYDKGGGAVRPDFVTAAIPDQWVVFPWERPADP